MQLAKKNDISDAIRGTDGDVLVWRLVEASEHEQCQDVTSTEKRKRQRTLAYALIFSVGKGIELESRETS